MLTKDNMFVSVLIRLVFFFLEVICLVLLG